MSPRRRPPGLLIRADTRPGIGAGHAMRQVALAERWVATDGEVTAVLDAPSPWLRSRLEAAGAEVIGGPEADGGGLDLLVERASEQAVDWVVLDGYRYDGAVQAAVAGVGPRVAVVDDHGQIGAQSPHVADVVIDPNLGPRRAGHDRRPEASALLQGPRFALLREEFRRPPSADQPARPRVVVLAGGERTGAGEQLADALAVAVAGRHPQIEVTTPARAGREDDLAALLSTAVLAVSAAGSTTWELAHRRVPMVLCAVAANQEPVGEELAAAGAARYLGRLDVTDPAAMDDLVATAVDLLGDAPTLDALAESAGALVDGYGAHRVATELLSALVDLRPATADDAHLLWTWANDPAVRAASFRSDPIPWEDHVPWLEAKLADPGSRLLVAEREGRPWGLVRFDQQEAGGGTEIAVSVAADARGGGAAASLIRAGVRDLFGSTGASTVLARVKPDNAPSLRAFRSADFEVVADAPGATVHLRYPRGRDGQR